MGTCNCTGIQKRRIRCIWGGSPCQKNQEQKIYDDDGYRILDHKQHFCNQKDVRTEFCSSFKGGETLKWSRASGKKYDEDGTPITERRANDTGRMFQYVLIHAE